MKKFFLAVILYTVQMQTVMAQAPQDTTESKWCYHFQSTIINNMHPRFRAKYSGTNSLGDSAETEATTFTAALFFGHRLWKGASVYVNPEISGGHGLSGALGVAGAVNGESYRVGDPKPSVFIARAYLQQTFALGNTDSEYVHDDQNQLAGWVPKHRISVSLGKFSMGDFYDDNAYSHDPRTQFSNWSLMGNGAWDYPANKRGYTYGVVIEWANPKWLVQLSSVSVPRIANSPKMEYRITKAHSETLEIERKLNMGARPGCIRLLVSNTSSRAPSYAAGMRALAQKDSVILNAISGNGQNPDYGGKKFAIGYSFDQELTNNLGVFSRASWNDGKYATWAFTEIDHTISAGLSLKGAQWKRPNDVAAIAGVLNGISKAHREFLAAGGYGFIIGDGALSYGHEGIIEAYYSARLFRSFWLTINYQFVNNPAYNRDRGPVHVFGARAHIEL